MFKSHKNNVEQPYQANIRNFLERNLDCEQSYFDSGSNRYPVGSYPSIFDQFGAQLSSGKSSTLVLQEKYNLRMQMVDSLNPAARAEVRKENESEWKDLYDGIPIVCGCIDPGGCTVNWAASSGIRPHDDPHWVQPSWGSSGGISFTATHMTVNHSSRGSRTYWFSNVSYPCYTRILELRLRVISSSTNKASRAPVGVIFPIKAVVGGDKLVYFQIDADKIPLRDNSDSGVYFTDSSIDTTVWHTYRFESDPSGTYRIFVDGVLLTTGMALDFGSSPYPGFGDCTVNARGKVEYEFVRHNYLVP